MKVPGIPGGSQRLVWLDMDQVFPDGVASSRGFWCQLPETFHLEGRKGVSDTILGALKVYGCEGEVVLKGEKGDGPEEIHDTGDFGALSVDDGDHSLVITGKLDIPIAPARPPYGTGKVDREELSPGNSYVRGRPEGVLWEPFALEPARV